MPSHAKSSLEAGLVALKQGNYDAAIAQLEPIAKDQNLGNACLQARVGLVMAYTRIGQVSKAIALCKNLAQSHNPQVQDWATRALSHLTKPPVTPPKSKKTATASVSFDHSSSHTNSDGDYTNFQPAKIYWRNARRAKVWQPLRKPNLINSIFSWLLATGTFIILFWGLRATVKLGMGLINQALVKLPYLNPLQFLYSDPTVFVLILLLVLIASSPWLLDWLLGEFYGQQELSKEKLNSYSRETGRVLQRTCQQKHQPLPKLRILPMSAPIMLTYGNLTRTTRITISQGLLEQLADDEIATIYALGLGQSRHRDLIIMSLVLLLTLPIYGIYQQASTWGNKISQKIWRWPITVLASLSYGLWSLITGVALLHARLRLNYSDRTSAEITGNPNALIRALLKISIGVSHDIAKQEHTNCQLESLNLLAPVSYQQSITLGSIAGHLPFESFFQWENFHPYRQWFTINNSHPLIGDRIERLCQIARHWHLDTELHLTNQKSLTVKPNSFLLQIAPWLGIPLGFVFAGLLWLTWQTAYAIHLLNLKWIYEDWSFVIGCILIAFSIGTLMRINTLFPDINLTSVQTNDHLPNLFSDASILPIDGISVRIVGKLIGRHGTSNYLGQDLILQSKQGLIKLNHIPWLGKSITPQDWIGRQIIVTGWFRRGATPWIDIQTLENQSGKTIYSPHPIWSTVLAVAAQAWGAYLFLVG
ncbi:M48 family metalloprotease [Cronbergia sp. UHCC 0137]|uniref:M48 family metalloprotease n=1 Tax=Cronbergia sp. UHCC 0137 TaxID=3110239 RepID=UPI002B1F071A|nr:M48 family metalloprotease [Cronbergia sp. UHCC 0137]MEA5619337.1 M48 family metalloprotease [Cronbergia sp. UHCC 0137]